MTNIATLTLNPAIDMSYAVEQVYHTRKVRTLDEESNPGGGGINVARVFVRLGGNATSFYLAGGATGPALTGLLDRHQLVHRCIPIKGSTRVSTAIHDRSTGQEYRFVPPGPQVSDSEWQDCLARFEDCRFETVVASGSLPRGVPDDFYARLSRLLAESGTNLVLDSSGAGLREGLAGGGIYLAKPSLGELRDLAGADISGPEEAAAAAMEIVAQGRAQLVAVTMGHEGAVLARAEGSIFLPAVQVESQSAVGAGDSFLAAMVHALGIGLDPVAAFRFGIAAGAAAVLTPGTGLARAADIQRLFAKVSQP